MKIPLLATLALASSASFLAAQTPILWTGGNGTSFIDNANWTGGVAPANDTTTNTARFGSSIPSNQPNLGGNRSVAGLVFESTTGGWTLSGSNATVLTLGASGINDSATSGNTTIQTSIQLSGGNSTYSVGVGGRVNILGSVFVDGAAATTNLTTFSNGTFSIRNINSTAGNANRAFNKGGNGTLIINEAAGAAWTGGNFRNSAGTTIIGHQNALGTGGILNLEAGTLQASTDLVGANAVTKQWNLNGGTAVISGSNSIELSGNMTGADNRTLQNDIASGKSLILSGAVMNISSTSNNRTMTLTGTGNTVISGNIVNGSTSTASSLTISNTGTTVLSGNNNYGGTTTISNGAVVRFAKVNSLYNGTEGSWTKTNINVSGGNTTFALNVGGTGEFTAANVTTLLTNLTVGITNNGLRTGTRLGLDTTNATGGVFAYSGVIANSTGTGGGALGLTKFGTGVLELTGTNTFTGGTIVNAGTLLVNNTSGSGTGSAAVAVASGAAIGGDGTIGGDLILSSGALFAFDTTNPNFTLTLSGTLTLDNSFGVASLRNINGGAIDWSLVANDTYTLMNTSFVFNNTNISNFGVANAFNIGGGRTAYFTNGSLALVVIPEPSSAALLMGGFLALAALRRRSK